MNAAAQALFDQGASALGRADLKGAEEAFRKCTELAPDSADAWCYLGMTLSWKEYDRARPALKQALALSPDHHGALYWLAEVEWISGNPEAAARHLQRLNDVAPDAPQNLARLGLAYMAAGDTGSSSRLFRQAVASSGGVASALAHHPELRRAIYLDLLGQQQDASNLIQSVNGGGIAAELPLARYPRDLEAQRCALENVVAGRDIVILGSGPSLEQLPALLTALGPRACEQLCFFGFNNVPVAERMLRDAIGRSVDLACMTSAAVMELHGAWIKEFLARTDAPNLFLTLVDAVPADRPLAQIFTPWQDKMFYFASSGDYPPIPEDPLHFPPINTLMCALPLAVLAQPRRIFLFGCDGAAPAALDGSAPVYFRQGTAEYGEQPLPPSIAYARWLERDTFFFNALIPTVLQSLSVLHRAPAPPILTCNPDSAYRPFPRISGEDFLRLQAEPVTERLFPARISQVQRQLDKLRVQIAGSAVKNNPVDKLKKQAGYLRRQAGRVKRFAMSRGMAVLRRLAGKIR